MPSSFGTALRVTVFGQSHSAAIGCVVEGLPSGFAIDQDELQRFMARRAPGQGSWTTPRKEADTPQILSGLNVEGRTCGAPLAAVIQNTNTRSGDYSNVLTVPRPGHADFTAWAKWHGEQDVPGGGHFSGRLTAPLCLAGGIALQMLKKKGVEVAAHLAQVGAATDERLDAIDHSPEAREHLGRQMATLRAGTSPQKQLPTIDAKASEAMLEEIEAARRDEDSVGGLVECVATGLPAGIGSPMFDGLENTVARAAFGIPAVKGVEFGAGFAVAGMRGSQNNDPYRAEMEQNSGGAVFQMEHRSPGENVPSVCVPQSNNAGGALGGISTGAPLLFRVAFKPTPSISRPQQSVDLTTMTNTTLEVHGRHDPCVAVRAVPVVEAVCALAVLDSWLAWPPEGRPFTL